MRMNNFPSTLNIPEILDKNLKLMERCAGDLIETIATVSTRAAANEAFKADMEVSSLFQLYFLYIWFTQPFGAKRKRWAASRLTVHLNIGQHAVEILNYAVVYCWAWMSFISN